MCTVDPNLVEEVAAAIKKNATGLADVEQNLNDAHEALDKLERVKMIGAKPLQEQRQALDKKIEALEKQQEELSVEKEVLDEWKTESEPIRLGDRR